MDSVVPSIPLRLDRERHLRLNTTALQGAERDLSALWGKTISIYAVLMETPMRLNDISVLLFHALRHEDPRLTQEEVCALMDLAPMLTIMNAINDAWAWTVRSANPEAPTPDADPTLPSIGHASGPLAASNSALVMTPSGA
jgi:hypothetical protein